MNDNVKSAGRVLDILELLARSDEAMALKDLVSVLALPKSSAHALLRTLQSRGYVERDAADRYALNESLRQSAGWIGGPQAHLAALARPVMEQLRDELEESVFLGVREARGDVKVIAKAVSRAAIRYDSDDPSPRTAYCTGMGRILLAFWDKKSTAAYLMRNRLRVHTPRTVTDAVKLRAILAKVAADGYAVVEEEYVLGGSATAAPVFGANGTVVAALNVGTVSARYPAAKPRIIAGVVRAAATISQRLGYRRAA
ncbi:MAG TPA: IclR family transcriptional regulator [Reyranella sp.]|nr:IclR family transcriptional regulator [Reyranella sp.]